MDILRKYKHFVNESVDSDKEVKTIADVPPDVIETARKIAGDMFDRVRKPVFSIEPEGLVMTFCVSEQDFKYIDVNEPLKLEVSEGAKKKRIYDVTLNYLDRISEMFEVKYVVNFDMFEDTDIEEDDLEEEDDPEVLTLYKSLIKQWKEENGNKNPGEGTRKRLWDEAEKGTEFTDNYERPNPEDLEYFDEDEADTNIKKGKIKLDDIEVVEDEHLDEALLLKPEVGDHASLKGAVEEINDLILNSKDSMAIDEWQERVDMEGVDDLDRDELLQIIYVGEEVIQSYGVTDIEGKSWHYIMPQESNEDFGDDEEDISEEFSLKDIGTSLRRSTGLFLTPEETYEKGRRMIKKSAKYRSIYDMWSKKDPKAAEKFITFLGENPNAQYMNYIDGEWSDGGEYNWGEGKGRRKTQ